MNLSQEMIRRSTTYLLAAALGIAMPVTAQPTLTLQDAVMRARAQHPDAGNAASAEREAGLRTRQARASLLPRVDLTESWQRGNQPVFVFGSRLAQRQFTADDFALPALNQPDAIDNFRAAVSVEQSLFNPVAKAGLTAAGLARDLATASRQLVDHDLASRVTSAYGRVLVAAGARDTAAATVERALADRQQAGHRRDAGLVTDADVLQLDVYVARAREQQIRAGADEQIARALLNQLMGEPLDARFALDPFAASTVIDTGDVAALEAEALGRRPDLTLARLQEQLAVVNERTARAAFLPQVAAQAGWEFNGGTWNGRASSWIVGAEARFNLFHGFADTARLAEAREQTGRLARERGKTETAVRLDVRIGVTRLESARASEAVGRAAVDQAREGLRIVRDRYGAGLADMTSLLRAAEAVAQAETQQTAARVAVLTETAALAQALGRP